MLFRSLPNKIIPLRYPRYPRYPHKGYGFVGGNKFCTLTPTPHTPQQKPGGFQNPCHSLSVATLPLFNLIFGRHTKTCRVLSCRSRPYVTPHSSTTCTTVLSYLCNPFCYYQVLIPLFRSESPFRHAISPLCPNTSHDSSPEIPRVPTLSSNQEHLSHPMSPQ